MKLFNKLSLLFIAILFCFSAQAQFLGIRASNFGGITNVNYNPAIADNRYKVDVNYFTFDATISNSYIGLKGKLSDFKNFSSDDNLSEHLNGKKKFGYASTTIQAPLSFLVSFGKNRSNNQAIAFSAHFNSVTNVDNLEEALARNLRWGWGQNAFDHIGNFVTTDFHDVNNVGVKSMEWMDAGVTYSRVVLDKDHNFLKVGATLKIIKGVAAMYAYSDHFKYKFDALDTIHIQDSYIHAGATQNLAYFYNDTSGYSASDFFNKDMLSNKTSNWSAAADIAVVYEYRKDKDKYKYNMDCKDLYYNDRDKHFIQVGLSVINIGRLKYKKADSVYDYLITDYRTGDNFNQNTLLQTWRDAAGSIPGSQDRTFKMWLPKRRSTSGRTSILSRVLA